MFYCKSCGNEFSKWEGKCSYCQEWGTLQEISSQFKTTVKPGRYPQLSSPKVIPANQIKEENLTQIFLNDQELKNLFNGGIFLGSSYLISGEPGIGKSTLLLLLAGQLNQKTLYVSGEETLNQIKKRIIRTQSKSDAIKKLYLTEDTNVESIQKKTLKEHFKILMIDSLQTIYDPNINGTPGSINQIKYAAQTLINFCRLQEIAVIITGHINKSGEIAGPKLIEHLVDSSFFFYSTQSIGHLQDIRVLSTLKNRFGPVEISALFIMTSEGLSPLNEVLSTDYFQENSAQHCGTCLFPHFIGKRLVFYEIESLTVPTKLTNPRRSVEGISISRLNRILAIIEKYYGIDFNEYDVFIQVTGGFKGEDLLIDLSLIACIYSSLKNFSLPPSTLYLGEVGLSGKIKRVSNLKMRTKEIDSYGQFLYFSSHQEKNQVIAVKSVAEFLQKLETAYKPV